MHRARELRCVRRVAGLVALALAGALGRPTVAAELRGRVLLGAEPVNGARVSLLDASGAGAIVYVDPAQIAARTGKDGRFVIRDVDAAKEWKLLVWDPYRRGEQGALVTADLAAENVIHVSKALRFLEPADGAVVAGPDLRVRWAPLAGAARYTLKVEEMTRSTAAAVQTVTAPEASLKLEPARYYFLTLQALDPAGTVIGEDCIPSCTVFQVGVADPKAERAAQPLREATCKIAGAEPKLYVAPTPGPKTEAPFMVQAGDAVRVRARLGAWRKVRTVTGFYPGRDGWLPEEQVRCGDASP